MDVLKRVSALILISALILTAAACGTSTEDKLPAAEPEVTDAVTESAETTEKRPEAELPDVDYDGYTFTLYIRNRDDFIPDMYSESLNGDLMNDAIFNRNATVADRFNIAFEMVRASDIYGGGAEKAILAGEDAYDLLICHARRCFYYAQSAMALDWNELKWVNLDQPWWYDDAREAFSFYNKLYAMIGDISYLNLGASDAMLFNKALASDYGFENLYDTVQKGEWTFDRFASYARSAIRDLNGDGVYDLDNDQMGYLTGWWIGPIQILYSADERVCGRDSEGNMILTLNTERTVRAFEKFFALTDSDGMLILQNDDNTDIHNTFMAGRAMFMDVNIKFIVRFREMAQDFGILPWPKLDETVDAYYANVDAGCNSFAVPVVASDPERTSAVLEALSYEGYKSVLPVYYDVVLTTKFTRDEDSAAMLDIVRAGRVFDIGYFYNNTYFKSPFNSVGYNLFKLADHSFASFYAQNESATLAAIEEINSYYRD